MTIGDTGGHDTLDAAGDTHDQMIDLHPGARSSVGGFKGNVTLSSQTLIEDVNTGLGTNTVMPNASINTVTLGPGSNTVAYNHDWDSTPHALDTIVGFKSGIDKLDLSDLPRPTGMDMYLEGRFPLADIITVDGASYVRRWNTRGSATHRGNPDFMVRVDGIQDRDVLVTKSHTLG
ncbi:hypothetical protein TU79_12360 [Pseudomonas trivialis]|nr:hypothetical protein TU79_12360 [Pseudomonas trivialis]